MSKVKDYLFGSTDDGRVQVVSDPLSGFRLLPEFEQIVSDTTHNVDERLEILTDQIDALEAERDVLNRLKEKLVATVSDKSNDIQIGLVN